MAESKDLLLDVYGGNSFVKVYQALEIDKIKFSFAKKGEEKDGIDVYMDAEDFASDLIRLIRNDDVPGQGIDSLCRRIIRERARAKEAGSKYCNAVWKSRAGKGNDGSIRSFEILPGSSTELVLTASSNGKKIIVGCDYRELSLLSYKWSYLEKDYNKVLSSKYTIANMKREFTGSSQQSNKPNASSKTENNSASATMQNKPLGYSSNARKPEAETRPAPQVPVESSKNMNPVSMKVKVTVGLMEMKSGGQAMKAVTQDGKEYSIIFSKDLISKAAGWNNFEEKCSCKGTIVNLKGFIKDDRVFVQSIA